MDYIKTLPLPPPRCRSAPHQLPPASAVCKQSPSSYSHLQFVPGNYSKSKAHYWRWE